jgi:hypothetical protein
MQIFSAIAKASFTRPEDILLGGVRPSGKIVLLDGEQGR